MNNLYKLLENKFKSSGRKPLVGREEEMIKNDEGIYVFKSTPEGILKRFVIFGSLSGSLNEEINNTTLTKILEVIKENPETSWKVVSEENKKNKTFRRIPTWIVTSYLYTLINSQDELWKQYKENFNEIIKLPTDLFGFLHYLKAFHGGKISWNSRLRKLISNWYLSKDIDQLTYYVLKYKKRYDWSHKDILRLIHIKPQTEEQKRLFSYITKKEIPETPENPLLDDYLTIQKINNEILDKTFRGKNSNLLKHLKKNPEFFRYIKEDLRTDLEEVSQYYDLSTTKLLSKATEVFRTPPKQVLEIIRRNKNITWEFIPSQWLTNPETWKVLLPNLPAEALFRNLPRFSSYGLTEPFSEYEEKVIEELRRKYKKAHPLRVAAAYLNYTKGKSQTLKWKVNGNIHSTLSELLKDRLANAYPKIFNNLIVSLDVTPVKGRYNHVKEASILTYTFLQSNLAHKTWVRSIHHSTPLHNKMSLNEILYILNDVDKTENPPSHLIEEVLNKKIKTDGFIIITSHGGWGKDMKEHYTQIIRKYRKQVNPGTEFYFIHLGKDCYSLKDPQDTLSFELTGYSPDLIDMIITLHREIQG